MELLLEVNNLTVCYSTAMLLNDLSLVVAEGELVSLVGPNGAGKTTLLRAISGLVRWEKNTLRGMRAGDITLEGTVLFAGERIDSLPAHEIVSRGLVHCPERSRPFREMTVLDNLKAGGYLCSDGRELQTSLEMVYHLFPILKGRGNQISGTLSGGERQMLAIGRALMVRPRLLCIDEPSTGLAHRLKEELFERIKAIPQSGIAVLLVEQDVGLAFQLASRSYILSHGRVVAEGTSEDLLKDETIRQTYLGL
ncbi:MAG: branched-chain amino acid ABC transporter ATP-binding protein [Chloroflexi bacterium RBG_13_54_8]|nr:MAG: branched-chain amino acid ABC transporter ATP-binding protein [Chloroflexi bacterium RBG_13_54_8]